MKRINLVLGILFSAIAILAPGALAAPISDFSGDISGSLEDVHCVSIFEGQTNDRVTVTQRKRNSDGYIVGMILKGVWYDVDQKRERHAFFEAKSVNWDVEKNDLRIIAASPGRNVLELQIDTGESAGGDFGHGEMKINGRRIDFLKFVCRTPIAG